jgi:hypothetical protein
MTSKLEIKQTNRTQQAHTGFATNAKETWFIAPENLTQ